MCGFTGIWFSKKDKVIERQVLQKMTGIISHRGPDAEGYHIERNMGFGFRRLSIIDLNTGNQPMCDLHERAWIVFNGEIYNYKLLRNELEKCGYQFKTRSDTEVIINSYLEYGEDFVNHLRGMFAFAIWDKKADKMILGRDRFGVKPLYYSLDADRIVFGSEMKSILKGDFSAKELDWQAVDSYFSYNYILSPLSIYKDIRKLSPGNLLVVENDGLKITGKIKKYWQPEFKIDDSKSFEDFKELIRDKLKETVEAHIVSDVPVGAFLSGGIDSNAVVANMARLYPEKVKTFSIGFRNAEYNEAVLARQSAAQYGTQHTELYLEPESADMIDKIVEMYDEPFADSSAIPTYFVSKLAAQYVKVVLSGDGGDEFFGGYNSYQRLKKIQHYKHLIRLGRPLFSFMADIMPATMKGKRFLFSLTKDPDLIYAYTMQVYEEEKEIFFHPDVWSKIKAKEAVDIKLDHIKESESKDYLSRMMELDISTYMVDDILSKVDRASMANSLEVRVPIIDHEFFEVAAGIPFSMKIKDGWGKHIFREAVKDDIPEYIYQKSKSGFTIPINNWFKNDLSSYCAGLLDKAKNTGIINPKYINTLLDSKFTGSLISKVWPIIVFVKWMNKIS